MFLEETSNFKRRRISNICRQLIPQSGGCNSKRTITIWLEPRHNSIWLDDLSFRDDFLMRTLYAFYSCQVTFNINNYCYILEKQRNHKLNKIYTNHYISNNMFLPGYTVYLLSLQSSKSATFPVNVSNALHTNMSKYPTRQ